MNEKAGFRKRARTRKARPDAVIKQENPTQTAPQIYAKIPGYDMAEVVEMVYKYSGRRKKLDHIFVQWPHIGPNKRRFKMTPFIRIKKRKARPWYVKAADRAARYLVRQGLKVYHFITDPARPLPSLPYGCDPVIHESDFLTPPPVQPYHLRHKHADNEN